MPLALTRFFPGSTRPWKGLCANGSIALFTGRQGKPASPAKICANRVFQVKLKTVSTNQDFLEPETISCMKRFLNATVLIGLLVLSVHALAADASLLKPPRGAKVAIVMFEDLQCPDCSKAYSIVWEAANTHKIPVVLHDFPLPMHNWAFEAAVWARYFDKISLDLGNEFRKFIYANQIQITRDNLLRLVQKFAGENKTVIPPVQDPDGKLAELVRADYSLGQRI